MVESIVYYYGFKNGSTIYAQRKFTCIKSPIETIEKGVKYVESQQ